MASATETTTFSPVPTSENFMDAERQDRIRGHPMTRCLCSRAGKILIAINVVIVLLLICILPGLHSVDEGHVGVYFRGGALLSGITYPGFHWKLPYFTSHKEVLITLQTDQVKHVPCGTSGGVMIYFDRIEVVNLLDADAVHNVVKKYTTDYDKTLIFDKIHHEVNQFCSSKTLQQVYIDVFDQIDETLTKALQLQLTEMAPGLRVQAIRVTKPTIPGSVRENYEKMEAEKTKLLVSTQHQKVVEKEAETDRKKAIIEAEKKASVAKIDYEKEIMQRRSQKTMSQLEDETHFAREKSRADAKTYTIEKESVANQKLLTDPYLELKRIEAIEKNNKVYYGDKIPNMFYGSPMSRGKRHVPMLDSHSDL